MKTNFILRIYNAPEEWFKEIQDITISNITLISKDGKCGQCMHKGNQKKFGYKIEMPKNFNKWGGSHRYPSLTFKGEYIDIIVKDFPRYPSFGQYKYSVPGYSGKPFPEWLEKNKVEFLNYN